MSRPIRSVLCALLLSCGAAVLPARALAAPFTELLVFGDSLSDPGNAHAMGGGLAGAFPPNYGYALPITRFTDGPTAAERLATSLGVSGAGNRTPQAGPNHAVGGALAGNGNLNWRLDMPPGVQSALPELRDTGVADQVARYAAGGGAPDARGSLAMLWAGANDFFLWTATGTPETLLSTAQGSAGAVAQAVDALYGLGARQFLVLDQPDLGAVPALAGDPLAQAAGSLYTQAYNVTLAELLAQAEVARPGLDVVAFDVAALFAEVTQSPGRYGLTNVTGACVADPAAALAGCPGYLFWDGVHPTAAGHALLADRLAAALAPAAVPVPGTMALILAGVAGLAARRRRATAATAG